MMIQPAVRVSWLLIWRRLGMFDPLVYGRYNELVFMGIISGFINQLITLTSLGGTKTKAGMITKFGDFLGWTETSQVFY